LLTQCDGLFGRAPGLSTPRHSIAERYSAQANLVTLYIRVGSDRTLATAAHRLQKRALGNHALMRVEMVQQLTDCVHALVVLAKDGGDPTSAHVIARLVFE